MENNNVYPYIPENSTIDIREKVRDGMKVLLWVKRVGDCGYFVNINHGWIKIKAEIKFNKKQMKWDFILDKFDKKEKEKPMGKEQIKQIVDGCYYNDLINPFNRVAEIL